MSRSRAAITPCSCRKIGTCCQRSFRSLISFRRTSACGELGVVVGDHGLSLCAASNSVCSWRRRSVNVKRALKRRPVFARQPVRVRGDRRIFIAWPRGSRSGLRCHREPRAGRQIGDEGGPCGARPTRFSQDDRWRYAAIASATPGHALPLPMPPDDLIDLSLWRRASWCGREGCRRLN